MEGMEEKLNAILSDPQAMQKIMSLAQSLGQGAPPPQEPEKRLETPSALPSFDPAMLQKLSRLAGQSGIDSNEQALLKALGPYLSRGKVFRLEKAMRASKMARLASSFLSSGGAQLLTGR